jgi:hypothetical protein
MTVTELPVTVPTSWSIDREVAPDALHAKVDAWPGLTVDGEAANEEIVGRCSTITAVEAVVAPVEFCAVNVYVVVVAGATATEFPLAAPTSGEIQTASAFTTDQESVVDPPSAMSGVDAAKLAIAGPAEAVTSAVRTLTTAAALFDGLAREATTTW